MLSLSDYLCVFVTKAVNIAPRAVFVVSSIEIGMKRTPLSIYILICN